MILICYFKLIFVGIIPINSSPRMFWAILIVLMISTLAVWGLSQFYSSS